MKTGSVSFRALLLCIWAFAGCEQAPPDDSSGTPGTPAPTIASFAATPASITTGGSSTLSWTTTNATSLSIDNGIGSVSGSSRAVTPTATTTYKLTATNSTGAVSSSTTVTVTAPATTPPPPPAPTIASFTASPTPITAGGSTTLSWTTTNATSLSIDNGIGVVSGTSRSVSPSATTTYRLTATNSTGSVSESTTVTVSAPPPPPQVTLRWDQPAAGTNVSGMTSFRLTGQAFQNVEVFRSGTMVVRATVSNDKTVAIANVDTTQFANGSVTLTAHAWNSPPGTAFTSDADAGSLTVNVNNPVASNPPILGVYAGNDVAAIQQFETWFGRRVDGILGYTGGADWGDYDGSVPWAANLWKAIDRPVLWSVPLIPKGATLEEAAKGTYNDHYVKAARVLAAYRPQDAVVYIRTGWEFNGSWFPWTTHGGKSQAFIGAFRQFVTSFRSVSSRFVFEWNVNIGESGANPEDAYPGNDYVDIVGIDFYWNLQWDSADPVVAWNSMLTRPWGLNWHKQFAAAHGKRMAYSEWGIMSSNAAPYIARAKAWFDANNVVYHSYWNSNTAFTGKISDGQYGAGGEAYRDTFK